MGCAWLGATAGAKQRQGVSSTVPAPESSTSASFEVPIALPTAPRVPATARSRPRRPGLDPVLHACASREEEEGARCLAALILLLGEAGRGRGGDLSRHRDDPAPAWKPCCWLGSPWPRAAGVAGEVGGEGVEEVRLGKAGVGEDARSTSPERQRNLPNPLFALRAGSWHLHPSSPTRASPSARLSIQASRPALNASETPLRCVQPRAFSFATFPRVVGQNHKDGRRIRFCSELCRRRPRGTRLA